MKWYLISEDYVPTDTNLIDLVLRGKSDDTNKYTPTREFLLYAYTKLNKLFFDDKLPSSSDINIHIGNLDEFNNDSKIHLGCTNISLSESGIVVVHDLLLNGTIMITLHEWVEAIIHEMIHIQEAIEYPNHFYMKDYDSHGEYRL